MHLTIVEWQVLASTLFLLPVAVAVIFAFIKGSFKDIEKVKYIVTERHEEDYWDTGGCDKQPPV